MSRSRITRSVARTFLFSDLRDYAAFVERAGDVAASRLLRSYRSVVRQAVARAHGSEIKTEGDSFYVAFDSSASAVRCALAIQRAAGRKQEPLRVGIGIHAGEATRFDRQYVGSAVNIAARLASIAGPGEILISDTVRGLVRTAIRLPYQDRGLLRLKGIAEPIRAYAIRAIPEPAPAKPPPATSGAMQAVLSGDLAESGQAAAMAAETSVGERCDRLAAMTLLAACRGDVEASLGRTERLLALALRAPDRSWVRVAYALRAWLYFLAQQPGEAHAELDRALERPGNSLEACMALTLATTLGGSPQQVEQLRSIAASCRDPAMARIVAAAATGLEGAGEPAEHESSDWRGGPAFLTALVGLQVSARRHRGTAMLSGTTVAGADQLAELIVAAAQ